MNELKKLWQWGKKILKAVTLHFLPPVKPFEVGESFEYRGKSYVLKSSSVTFLNETVKRFEEKGLWEDQPVVVWQAGDARKYMEISTVYIAKLLDRKIPRICVTTSFSVL